MNKIEIKSLKKDMKIEGCLLVKSIEEKIAKTGKPFYQFTLTDGDLDISGVYFTSKPLSNFNHLKGKILCFIIETQIYNDRFSCKVISYDINTEITPELRQAFVRKSLEQSVYEEYTNSLFTLIELIEDIEIKELCEFLFLKKHHNAFISFPAAKANHHIGFGGLLEHSVNLAKISLFFADYYQYDFKFDKDLLIAGALFQDIGKIFEFDVDSEFNATYSNLGKLKGHIAIGNEILYEGLQELGIKSNQDKFSRLSHIILSHHGAYEFGSPSLPVTPEALLIARCDKLDADMKATLTAVKSAREDEEYSPKVFSLNNVAIMLPNTHIYKLEELGEVPPSMEDINKLF